MKRGDRFFHRYWQDACGNALLCVVTALKHGEVYYRPLQGGKSMRFSIANVDKYVGVRIYTEPQEPTP